MEEATELALQLLDPNGYYRNFVKDGVRPDGRGFAEMRKVSAGRGLPVLPSNVCGSSAAQIGRTEVMCTISVLVGTPCQEYPDSGDVEFDVSLWPICSLKYEQRSKPDDAYILEAFLDDLVTKGKLLDLTQLGIERGKFAYRLYVNIVCLSEDGNLVDASVLALTRALLSTRLPVPICTGATVTISTEDPSKMKQLTLMKTPISVSCGLFDDKILLDPAQKEEGILRGRITCVCDVSDETLPVYIVNHHINSGSGLTPAQLSHAIKLCQQTAVKLRPALTNL